jgi:hypothetical protein
MRDRSEVAFLGNQEKRHSQKNYVALLGNKFILPLELQQNAGNIKSDPMRIFAISPLVFDFPLAFVGHDKHNTKEISGPCIFWSTRNKIYKTRY